MTVVILFLDSNNGTLCCFVVLLKSKRVMGRKVGIFIEDEVVMRMVTDNYNKTIA